LIRRSAPLYQEETGVPSLGKLFDLNEICRVVRRVLGAE